LPPSDPVLRILAPDRGPWLNHRRLYRIEHDKITQIDIFEANQYEVDEFFA
jgi:hypothetical protein